MKVFSAINGWIIFKTIKKERKLSESYLRGGGGGKNIYIYMYNHPKSIADIIWIKKKRIIIYIFWTSNSAEARKFDAVFLDSIPKKLKQAT